MLACLHLLSFLLKCSDDRRNAQAYKVTRHVPHILEKHGQRDLFTLNNSSSRCRAGYADISKPQTPFECTLPVESCMCTEVFSGGSHWVSGWYKSALGAFPATLQNSFLQRSGSLQSPDNMSTTMIWVLPLRGQLLTGVQNKCTCYVPSEWSGTRCVTHV